VPSAASGLSPPAEATHQAEGVSVQKGRRVHARRPALFGSRALTVEAGVLGFGFCRGIINIMSFWRVSKFAHE